MSLLNWLRTQSRAPRSTSAWQGVAYAYWSCLSDNPQCKAQGDIVWIPSLANPPKPRGCRCDLVHVYSGERGAPELTTFIRRHGGIATFSAWDTADENPDVIQHRMRNQSDKVIEDEGAARRLEKEDPARAIDLYWNVTAEITRIASAGDEWTWRRRLPSCYNRLSMLLERLKRSAEAIEAIHAYYEIHASMHPTKADAEGIAKRLDRLSKTGEPSGDRSQARVTDT